VEVGEGMEEEEEEGEGQEGWGEGTRQYQSRVEGEEEVDGLEECSVGVSDGVQRRDGGTE